jgi:hypothetical protein
MKMMRRCRAGAEWVQVLTGSEESRAAVEGLLRDATPPSSHGGGGGGVAVAPRSLEGGVYAPLARAGPWLLVHDLVEGSGLLRQGALEEVSGSCWSV